MAGLSEDIETSYNTIVQMEELIIKIAKKGRRNKSLELEFFLETDNFLRLTHQTFKNKNYDRRFS